MKQEFMFQIPNLKLLRGALSTIKPTSTQNEGNFSNANDFVSTKRSRLSSESLYALCFLKIYIKLYYVLTLHEICNISLIIKTIF